MGADMLREYKGALGLSSNSSKFTLFSIVIGEFETSLSNFLFPISSVSSAITFNLSSLSSLHVPLDSSCLTFVLVDVPKRAFQLSGKESVPSV